MVGDDHARACTGRRLIRLGLVRNLGRKRPNPDRAVVLDPYAAVPLAPADRVRAEAGGVVAVDCSWNRLSAEEARKRALGGSRRTGGRRLPMLVAANPQHFGRLGELNTVEALAATVYLLGRPQEAAELLAGFAGGPTFLEVNRERLERYARAGSPEEIVQAERELFSGRPRPQDDRPAPRDTGRPSVARWRTSASPTVRTGRSSGRTARRTPP